MTSNYEGAAKEIDLGMIDVSIADALCSRLLKNPEVIFAGVTPPHPLFGKVTIKILTKKKSPEECLIEASKEVKNSLNVLYNELSSSLQKAGGN
ncbi:MAG: RpoL/Rpb11 RNA polymerase subunit family protein [Nitrososphaeria archaeon]